MIKRIIRAIEGHARGVARNRNRKASDSDLCASRRALKPHLPISARSGRDKGCWTAAARQFRFRARGRQRWSGIARVCACVCVM